MVLFTSLAAAAALAGSSSASPLFRRQAGNGLPSNATLPDFTNADNITYNVVPTTENGSSYLNATVESIPLGVNASGWNVTYTNGTEPYPNAHIILGNPTKNGTNTTMAWPGMPAGGQLIYKPTYTVESNFDFQSLNLALNQELIELDLFYNALARFSTEEFEAAGLNADDRHLLEQMAAQEIGHAVALTNILGVDRAAKQCIYQYPYNSVKEFIAFSQILTRWGEAGVYGFLGQLDSKPAAQILLQSITTEARQQVIFRQMQGLPAMPEWFTTGLPQSYAWTLLSPYIKSCPPNNPRIEFTRFPLLNVTNQPYALDGRPGINSNYTLTEGGGRAIHFEWEPLNQTVGYDGLYKTESVAGEPKFLAFISQLNVTYAPIYNVSNNSAWANVPNGTVFPGEPQVVNTAFISLVDSAPYLTPLINNVTLAVGHLQVS
ncbi:conserved fungal protein [Rhodotorula kratochvilovae]